MHKAMLLVVVTAVGLQLQCVRKLWIVSSTRGSSNALSSVPPRISLWLHGLVYSQVWKACSLIDLPPPFADAVLLSSCSNSRWVSIKSYLAITSSEFNSWYCVIRYWLSRSGCRFWVKTSRQIGFIIAAIGSASLILTHADRVRSLINCLLFAIILPKTELFYASIADLFEIKHVSLFSIISRCFCNSASFCLRFLRISDAFFFLLQ